jgi:hypothetical protein
MKLIYDSIYALPEGFEEKFFKIPCGYWRSNTYSYSKQSYTIVVGVLTQRFPSIKFSARINDGLEFRFEDDADEAAFIMYQDTVEIIL